MLFNELHFHCSDDTFSFHSGPTSSKPCVCFTLDISLIKMQNVIVA